MTPMKPKAAPMAEIVHREDGRIEVVRDGRILWCGRDIAVAQSIVRKDLDNTAEAQADRRHWHDAAVHRSISSPGDI